ncbi:MAG: Hydroxypyruvate isomerase [Verrucomicrobia subdivision 3 bacterium]|nr:Hydroxypyruvate isomerase [Limisphaerales bacterium]MCS1414907.1 Hydroxypyruvate isomerase [Limisphaerales bacterium]
MKNKLSRRSALKTSAGAAIAAAMTPHLLEAASIKPIKLGGKVRHSVCKWCYRGLSVEELAQAAAQFGMHSVELLDPADFPIIQKHGLLCAMSNGPGKIAKGFNRRENHGWLIEGFQKMIPQVANAGFPNIICFSGNREGLDDEEGLKVCAEGLKKVMPIAEKHKITVCMELLNSKVNHKDYQCDKSAWGIELCNRVGSERFKLLYDIYHMQIMEGDVIRTIRENHPYFAHYHTGGNPGRNEIDHTQELNYRAISQAIVDTGFKGYIAQEFIPKRHPLGSLYEAVRLCDV